MANDLRSFYIVTMLLCLFALGIFGLKNDLVANYGVTESAALQSTESKFTELLTNTQKNASQIASRTETSGGLEVESSGFIIAKEVFSIIKLPFKLIPLMSDMLTEIGNNIPGLPTYIMPAIIAILLVSIAWIVISKVLRDRV